MKMVWLIYTVAVATSVSLAFNIDTRTTHIFTTENKDFFLKKVLRFLTDKNEGTLVTEQLKGPEETCSTDLSPTHRCLIIPDISRTETPTPIRHFGLSISEDSTHSQITVCSPSAEHPCYENASLNKICYRMADHHQQISSFTPAFQEFTTKTVDLVFLVDGSASMTEAEFNKNKEFIVDIMDSLKNTSIRFAAVQFSSDYRKVFDFSDYEAGSALEKLMKEKHLKQLTNTHKALGFVLHEILENPAAGISPDATKAVVLITDGNPSDTDRQGIIKQYDDKNIIRLVIGVGAARLEKFRDMASEPKDKHTYKIEDYNGLTGVLENVVNEVFNLKGSKVAQSKDMTHEISQSGFSAVFNKVCSPSVVSGCSESSYMNIVCLKVTTLQQTSSFTPVFEECTKKTVEVVFLFDGSASMTEKEFSKNKDFIVEMMDSFKNTSVKFAAVQFSSDYRKVFDFNDYEAGSTLDKLMTEKHLKQLTSTHKALRFVLHEILENPAAGASPDATKAVVLITDGDPSDTDRQGIIKQYDDKNITRLVIGIKDAKLEKFRAIASEPKDKHAYKTENYDGLTGVLENIVNKVFNLEGSKVARAENMTHEISQSGFNAVFNKDTLILGSVESNSWRSFLQEHQERNKTQTEDTDMQVDFYLGNSLSIGEKNGVPLYFTGAPRFEHTGQVVLFRHHCKNWTAAQRINGDQIGSFFGAELCSLDINSDGNTDFLLVGAPLFNQPQEEKEGRIYVYTLTDEMLLESNLDVTAPSTGRFGTTISSLADLNGDGLRDIAVGAPLEDDNSGAVYIYLGDRQRGIRSTFSQRIMGKKIKCGMRFFGQAIVWGLGEDRHPGIVVGSQGAAVVLRSKPVFNVLAHLSFRPEKMSTEELHCLGPDENVPLVNVTACFEMVDAKKSETGSVNSGLNITYMLNVDPMRQTHRGFFSQTDKTARNLTATFELRDGNMCFDYSIHIPNCVEDTSSPIEIKLNFFQADTENASDVLNLDNEKEVVTEIPFKN